MGVHPTSDGQGGEAWTASEKHEISLVCDDIDATVAELSSKGAEFTRAVRDDGFGLTTEIKIPGTAQAVMLYQPKYDPPALAL